MVDLTHAPDALSALRAVADVDDRPADRAFLLQSIAGYDAF
jgi:hypothetical protein